VKRDFDLIRSILLHIEESPHHLSGDYEYHFDHSDQDAVANALELLAEKSLIISEYSPTSGSHPSDWHAEVRMTWEGHDFLDSVRDPKIWKLTKDGAKQAGGAGFDLLKALAKGFVKKKIEEHTGVKLEL
jgi:hypothetical protein